MSGDLKAKVREAIERTTLLRVYGGRDRVDALDAITAAVLEVVGPVVEERDRLREAAFALYQCLRPFLPPAYEPTSQERTALLDNLRAALAGEEGEP